MNTQINLQDGFFLDDWFVEPQLGRLTKEKKSVQLEPKIMQVLVFLAENQDKTVKKQQFFEIVWADVNVSEHVLARAISALRRIFGDDPQKPLFIETIPKIGYRLIMPVSLKNAGNSDEKPFASRKISSVSPTTIKITPRELIMFLAFVSVLLILVFLIRGHSFHS